MGYKFQFVTLAGFHSLNHAHVRAGRAAIATRGMAAYSELQQAEFASEADGYTATRHQREVGTGYFDLVAQTLAGGEASTTALAESTEAAQFTSRPQPEEKRDDERYWVSAANMPIRTSARWSRAPRRWPARSRTSARRATNGSG